MTIHEAEAIILRQYPLSDSDRIIVCLTREYGKIRAVARGVKKLESRLAACLEPLSHSRIEFYLREGRDLGQIRSADIIQAYLGGRPGLKRVCAYNYFAEIADELVQENQPNGLMFRLLLRTMAAGNKHGINDLLLRYFEVWCLKLNGLFPNYAYCSNCGKCVKDDVFFAYVEIGQPKCEECAQGYGLKIGSVASRLLTLIIKLPPEAFILSPTTQEAALEIERLTQGLLAHHLERRFKSYQILQEVLRDT